MSQNPVDFLRNSIKTSESKGLYWTFLAEFFIRQGQFGLARDIFEESLEIGVDSVKDFTIIFNSYVKFEQQMMLFEESLEECKGCDLKYQRLENLLERRPFLLSDLVLK